MRFFTQHQSPSSFNITISINIGITININMLHRHTTTLTMPHNFAITGVAGYVAPRHLKAIRETGNRLVAATDPHDSVGRLDAFSFDVAYFREFERFDRHLEKLRRKGPSEQVDYLSICAPNYLHDAHVRLALRVGADAICEKPLVLNPWNCDALEELAGESGRRVCTVMQLRCHPAVVALKKRVAEAGPDKTYDVDLTYITARGRWYLASWKGDPERSGGLTTNIGIHLFDMLVWVFGSAVATEVHVRTPTRAAGYLELERARVRWFLSIDTEDLPEDARREGRVSSRSVRVAGEEVDLSSGFADLHTQVYRDILGGGGFGIADVRPSIALARDIRTAEPIGVTDRSHEHLRT